MSAWAAENRRQVLGLSAVVVALVVVVVLAVFVPGENVTRLIAVGGFFVTLGKTLYDIREKAQERKKKEEEKAEKVRAKLVLGGGGYNGMSLQVELFNHGSTRVAIKRVALCGEFRGQNFASEMAIPDRDSVQRHLFNREPIDVDIHPKTVTLEPKDHAVFYLKAPLQLPDCAYPFDVKDFVAFQAESLRVVVESFNGELTEISGEEIHEAIHRQTPADFPTPVYSCRSSNCS